MIVSDARLAANRANAARSTGPRTAEGKERSRCNAVKHGLTGEGVAISSEDAEAIERRFLGLQDSFRPVTEAGRNHVRRAAMLSVRLERCVIQEAAAISMNVRAAEADFDEAREAVVDDLFEQLAENPSTAVRRLVRMPEGVDRMLETWLDLREDLTTDGGSRWGAEHGQMALRLIGRNPGGFGVPRIEALSRAIEGDFSLLGKVDGGGLGDLARRAWAREALAEVIDAAMAKLEEHRATLDLEAIEADRAGAKARALFDPSRAATLARKYEAAAERGMFRAIREMREVEYEAAERGESASASAPMASFSPPTPARVVPPSPEPVSARSVPRFESSEGSNFVPITVGRPERALS